MGLPRCKNLWTFSLFRSFCFSRFYCADFFVFFVLRHPWVQQVLTPRMSPLNTTAVTELWRLDLFCTSSSFLSAGMLSPRSKCCYFCGRFSWSRQTSLSKGFSYYFHDSTTELYFCSTTRQCRCYSKTKTTKYCLKHEGKSHPWQRSCFITRWRVFYKCVQLVKGEIMLISINIILFFNFEKNIS